MVRILICDDQVIVCEGLRVILSTTSDIEIVGIANDGARAVELADQLKPDLVLMDLKMPGVSGIQATREIRDSHPEIFVLVLTTYDADEWVFDAIRSGASGYMLKDAPRDQLVQAIHDTIAGKTHVDPAVAGKLFAHISHSTPPPDTSIADELSERERDVLRLLAKGMSNAEIAAQLFLSQGTVRNYVSSIFAKLDISDRTQAAVIALRYGLADFGETQQ